MAALSLALKALGGATFAKDIAKVATKLFVLNKSFQELSGSIKDANSRFRSFEKAMADVGTLLVNDQANVAKLTKEVDALVASMGLNAQDTVKGLYQIISSGVRDPAEAMELLTESSKLAIAGVTDLSTAANGSTAIMNAYKLQLQDITDIGDAMQQTVVLGRLRMENLSSAMSIAMPIAANLGIGYKDILAGTATMTKQAFTASESMTGLRSAIRSVLQPTKVMKQLFDKLGVSTGQELISNAGSLQNAFVEIREAAGGNILVLEEAIRRVEGFNALLALTGKNAKTAASDLLEIKSATGAVNQAVEVVNRTQQRWGDRSQAVFDSLKRDVGSFTSLFVKFKDIVVVKTAEALGVVESLREKTARANKDSIEQMVNESRSTKKLTKEKRLLEGAIESVLELQKRGQRRYTSSQASMNREITQVWLPHYRQGLKYINEELEKRIEMEKKLELASKKAMAAARRAREEELKRVTGILEKEKASLDKAGNKKDLSANKKTMKQELALAELRHELGLISASQLESAKLSIENDFLSQKEGIVVAYLENKLRLIKESTLRSEKWKIKNAKEASSRILSIEKATDLKIFENKKKMIALEKKEKKGKDTDSFLFEEDFKRRWSMVNQRIATERIRLQTKIKQAQLKGNVELEQSLKGISVRMFNLRQKFIDGEIKTIDDFKRAILQLKEDVKIAQTEFKQGVVETVDSLKIFKEHVSEIKKNLDFMADGMDNLQAGMENLRRGSGAWLDKVKTVLGIFNSIASAADRIASAQQKQGLAKGMGMLGGFTGGLGGVVGGIMSLFHDGGAIQRLHKGGVPNMLSSDEVPIIAQAGEFMLSKNAVQNMGGQSAVKDMHDNAVAGAGAGTNVKLNLSFNPDNFRSFLTGTEEGKDIVKQAVIEAFPT